MCPPSKLPVGFQTPSSREQEDIKSQKRLTLLRVQNKKEKDSLPVDDRVGNWIEPRIVDCDQCRAQNVRVQAYNARLIYWFELKWFYSAHDKGSTKRQFVLKFSRTITRSQVIPLTYVTGSFGRPLI